MTIKEFVKLKPGTPVQWREKTGEVTERGLVVQLGRRKYAEWPDGQQTDSTDDWALTNIEEATC